MRYEQCSQHSQSTDSSSTELVTGCKTEDIGVKKAMLKALYEVISKAGPNMSEASKAAVLSLLETTFDEAEGLREGPLP